MFVSKIRNPFIQIMSKMWYTTGTVFTFTALGNVTGRSIVPFIIWPMETGCVTVSNL